MKELIEKVMKLSHYPDQSPPWTGYEYVPKTDEELRKFCEVVSYSWWEGVEWGCLQIDGDRFVVAIDCNVWEVREEEFYSILKKLEV